MEQGLRSPRVAHYRHRRLSPPLPIARVLWRSDAWSLENLRKRTGSARVALVRESAMRDNKATAIGQAGDLPIGGSHSLVTTPCDRRQTNTLPTTVSTSTSSPMTRW